MQLNPVVHSSKKKEKKKTPQTNIFNVTFKYKLLNLPMQNMLKMIKNTVITIKRSRPICLFSNTLCYWAIIHMKQIWWCNQVTELLLLFAFHTFGHSEQ